MAIARLFTTFRNNLLLSDSCRSISLSASRNLKEIIETKQGNTTIVEGVIKPDPKEHLWLKPSENGACSLCSLGVEVKHTDVLILRQFMKPNGHILHRRITGLCYVQHKRIGILITMAQKAGLMPNLTPANSKKDPKKRHKWKQFNTYFDENTIKQKYY